MIQRSIASSFWQHRGGAPCGMSEGRDRCTAPMPLVEHQAGIRLRPLGLQIRKLSVLHLVRLTRRQAW